ncbi:hypothetical protein MKZ38_009343 [Zalerion maritima]|uniref:DNA-directed RNA polymerase III complex subunit Rpc37 n=1 Tax=Zalerion maritima TaxID=339359 RepID=A0AAD5RVA7_9PEZI|nr:hypothetical protein MKZ38_009343 [Zalerion maritima]
MAPNIPQNAVEEEDDDPIIQSYNVFLQPSAPEGRSLLVLHQPNQKTNRDPLPPATEVRLKRNAGVVEIDYPIDLNRAYDQRKGMEWGAALQRSTASKNGGSHGLGGGFSVGAPPSRFRKDDDKDDEMMDWNEAKRLDMVMRTSTHGGVVEKETVNYMIGVFQGNNLHLTPTTAVLSIRPQHHHIDAMAELNQRRTAAAAAQQQQPSAAPAGPNAGGRAIHMTIKTGSGNEVSTETMADRLKAVQNEKWERLEYVDENQERAWASYEENLIIKPNAQVKNEGENAPAQSSAARKGKAPVRPSDPDALVEQMPHLQVKTTEEDIMYSISGLERPMPLPYRDAELQEIKTEPDAAPAPSRKARGKKKA